MKATYGHNFYQSRHQLTHYSADTILTLALSALPDIRSAVDFGCGVGTWLSVLKDKGITTIQGFDGSWVEQDLLQIPHEKFRQVNLEDKIELPQRYDLAISLEVAEHLHSNKAATFVVTLVSAADFILFSAAIPFQGGKGHVNEQWPDYWAALFAEHDYEAVDIIRRQVWSDKQIPMWYRQNLLLYVKRSRLTEVKFPTGLQGISFPQSIVHPDTYMQMTTVKGSFKLFRRAIKRWLKGLFANK